MIPAWTTRYVGIPFLEHGRDRSGCDCWGLLRLVLQEQFGVVAPSYDAYQSAFDSKALDEYLGGLVRDEWEIVPRGTERAGDGVLIRVQGCGCHVGIVVAPGVMLHTMKGTDSCAESYTSPKWERRILNIWRHKDLR